MKRFYRAMLSAVSADETAVTWTPADNEEIPETLTHVIEWGTSVSAGEIQIEGSHSASYAGTWAPIHTFTYASGSPKQEYVTSAAQFKVIRHRINTAITGGTVSSSICGAR